MRAKFLAMTQEMPQVLMAMGACSREEPQPKLTPATMMSPSFTRVTKDLSMSSMQWEASSLWFWVFRLRAGMMTSVSMWSPYLCTDPCAFICLFLHFAAFCGEY